ncbi:MAG: DUF4384 domain-containing protein [Desulfobacterales bacterium]|nr:DUF4384 domain-containing protein [Desulfobacterales bacterium]
MKCNNFKLIGIPWIVFLTVFFITNPNMALSQEQRSVKVTAPDDEMRSSIHSVDGYAYLSDNMTLTDIRAAAFADAKRKALEMAKTFIQSKTKVEDFVVKYDVIWSEAEGAVSVHEQKDFGIEENSRYHVWIKAEIEYSLKPKGKEIPVQDLGPGGPLTVKVWTSKKTYKEGENIQIFIQGNRNYYARIVNISSDGEIIQLLPNGYRQINYFEAGKVYKIPDQGDLFSLTVSPPYGEDQIVVYASEVPLGQVNLQQMGQGLSRYQGTRSALSATTRGIAVAAASPGNEAGAEFYEASWKIETGEK